MALTPGRQLGLLWGGVALSLVLLSPLAPRIAEGLPPCPFRALTGVPCAACGTGRAALALAHLDPLQALSLNPLAALGWMVLVGGGLIAGALAVVGVELRGLPRRLPVWVRLAAVLLFLLNWLFVAANLPAAAGSAPEVIVAVPSFVH